MNHLIIIIIIIIQSIVLKFGMDDLVNSQLKSKWINNSDRMSKSQAWYPVVDGIGSFIIFSIQFILSNSLFFLGYELRNSSILLLEWVGNVNPNP